MILQEIQSPPAVLSSCRKFLAELLAGCNEEPTLTAHLGVTTLLLAVFPSEILAGDLTAHTEVSMCPIGPSFRTQTCCPGILASLLTLPN